MSTARIFRSFALLLGLVIPMTIVAQVTADPEHGLHITERKAGFRVLFNFDFRRTFVDGDPVRFYGFRLGVQRQRDVLSVGFYGLGDVIIQPNSALGDQVDVDVVTDFDYVGLGYERLLIDSKRWVIGIPLSVGLGNYRRGYRDSTGVLIPYSVNELVPIELSLHTDLNVFYWLFIGVGGGYRHVLAADREATVALSDITYYFKAGVRFGELLKRARRELRSTDGS